MRELAVIVPMILFNSSVAQNLIPNHSFEIIDDCPQPPGTLGYQLGAIPTGWWRWGGTPDYFNSCVSDTLGSVPINLWGYQHALDGNAYSGFFSNFNDGGPDGFFRETIGTELSENLTIGQTYYVSMYVSMSMGGYYNLGLANNKMGLLCTTVPHYTNDLINDRFPIQNHAHVYATDIIVDTTSWVLITGSFTADSAYQYVVIGNHFDNDNTDTSYVITSIPVSYYYIDKVCLSPIPNGCDIAHNVDQQLVDPLIIFPNPSSNVFTIRSYAPSSDRMALFDTAGKIVWEYQGLETEVTIGQELSSGIYILRLQAGGSIHHYKLVKS